MGKIKPVERLLGDVNKGDIVRLIFNAGEFVGYFMGKDFVNKAQNTENPHYEFCDSSLGPMMKSVLFRENTLYLDGGRFSKNCFRVDNYEVLRRAKKSSDRR